MKRITFSLLTLYIIFSSSCTNTFWELDNESKEIIFINSIIISGQPSDGNFLLTVEEVVSKDDYSNNQKKVIFFDSLGNIKSILFDRNKTKYPLNDLTKYNYDNNQLKEYEYNTSGEYNSKGTFFYNENGSITKLEDKNYKNEVLYHFYNIDKEQGCIIDSGGLNVIKYFFRSQKLDSVIDNYSTTYYNNNIPQKVKYVHTDENGTKSVSSTITYEYTYDPKGNWIQKRSFIDGKEEKVVNRQIFYKGQDISEYEKKYNDFVSSLNSNSSLNNNQQNFNDNSSSTYTDQSEFSSNSSSSNSYQKTEKQQQTCSKCQGKGVEVCRKCSGNGMIQCSWCNNTGRKYYQGRYETCSECNGNMRKNCDRCYGKGNTGSCYTCRGLGYYFK